MLNQNLASAFGHERDYLYCCSMRPARTKLFIVRVWYTALLYSSRTPHCCSVTRGCSTIVDTRLLLFIVSRVHSIRVLINTIYFCFKALKFFLKTENNHLRFMRSFQVDISGKQWLRGLLNY